MYVCMYVYIHVCVTTYTYIYRYITYNKGSTLGSVATPEQRLNHICVYIHV